jgi:glycosyltransferase involved in cell wall biosynthesis
LLTVTDSTDVGSLQHIESWGVPVEAFTVSRVRSLLNCVRAVPTHLPLQAVYSYNPGMANRLAQLDRSGDFDVIHVEHLRASRLTSTAPKTPVIYDSVDCISLLFEQASATSPQLRSRLMAKMDLARTRRYEAQLLTRYDHIVITSKRDRQALQDLAKQDMSNAGPLAPITVVGNGVDLTYFRNTTDQRDKQTIIFTGKMSYHANVTAVLHFVKHILPGISRERPETRFVIAGKDPPDSIRRLTKDARITVTGYVEDLRPYLSRATVAVCPIRYSVGVQNKVLEAMAVGTPVVTTPDGCAALEVTSGKELLIAESPAQFADAVLAVLREPTLASQLSSQGRAHVERCHTWAASARKLTQVYTSAVKHDTSSSEFRSGTGPARAEMDGQAA